MRVFMGKEDHLLWDLVEEVTVIKVCPLFLPFDFILLILIIDFYSYWNVIVSGYDGVPVEAMQALDINEGHYGHAYHNGGSDINYENEVPNPPQDNNQVAAWYDTDL